MRHRRALLAALLAHAVGVVLFAQTAPQQPPPGRGRGAAQAPAPGVVQVSGHPPVDAAKADAGKAVWVAECIDRNRTFVARSLGLRQSFEGDDIVIFQVPS